MSEEGQAAQDREDRKAFYTALAAAQEAAPNIEPTRVHYDGYPYASASDVRDLYGPILREHGLVYELAGTSDRVVDELEQETRNKGLQYRTDVLTIWRVVHAPTGFQQVYRVLGRRTNEKDKGVQHAITSAEKVFVLRLMNASEEKDEEGPNNRVEKAERSRRPGSGQKKKAERRAPNAPAPPPPKQNGNPIPPQPQATPETRVEFAKGEVRAFLRSNHFQAYHFEAVVQTDKMLSARKQELWGVTEWEGLLEITKKRPRLFDEAPRSLAVEFPTSPERVELLDKLTAATRPPGPEKMLIESAKQAGWCDAVEWWIEKLLERNEGVLP